MCNVSGMLIPIGAYFSMYSIIFILILSNAFKPGRFWPLTLEKTHRPKSGGVDWLAATCYYLNGHRSANIGFGMLVTADPVIQQVQTLSRFFYWFNQISKNNLTYEALAKVRIYPSTSLS